MFIDYLNTFLSVGTTLNFLSFKKIFTLKKLDSLTVY